MKNTPVVKVLGAKSSFVVDDKRLMLKENLDYYNREGFI